MKNVGMAGEPTEIRTEHFPNTDLECCLWNNPVQWILTHCGRMMQTCVFEFQAYKTDDADLRL
jgi:hypothetical protein